MVIPLLTDPVPTDIFDLISRGGIVAFLLVVVWAGIKRKWVFGWVYDALAASLAAMTTDRDQWKTLALSLLQAQERQIRVQEKTVATMTPPRQ